MLARVTCMLFVSVLLWTQSVGQEGFTPIEWSPRVFSGNCEERSDPDLTSALASVSEMLSRSSRRSSLPESCLEIINISPDSPSGYYTLLDATSGATSIIYCDMEELLLSAPPLTSVQEKLQVANLQGEKGEVGAPGETGQKGEMGVIGPVGQKGDTGSTGPRGATGPQGFSGANGASGQKGSTGSPGPTGTTGPPGPLTAGAVYTRWGSSSCPNVTGTQTVYQGRAGKTYSNQGGGANYQCMPDDPEYYTDLYNPGVQNDSRVYGVEYEDPINGVWHAKVPCAACYASTREAVMTIPARLTCPTSWTLEYSGYLMTQRKNESGATFECVDVSQEVVPNSQDVNTGGGGTFYHVEASCNGLACPAYDEEKELTCVVCTR